MKKRGKVPCWQSWFCNFYEVSKHPLKHHCVKIKTLAILNNCWPHLQSFGEPLSKKKTHSCWAAGSVLIFGGSPAKTNALIRVCQVPFDQLKTWINGEAEPSTLNTLTFGNNCLISAVGAITVSWVTRKISCVHMWKVRKVKMRSIKPANKNTCRSKFQSLNHNTSVEILQSTAINPCTTYMCFHNVTGFSRGQREHRKMEDKLEELWIFCSSYLRGPMRFRTGHWKSGFLVNLEREIVVQFWQRPPTLQPPLFIEFHSNFLVKTTSTYWTHWFSHI